MGVRFDSQTARNLESVAFANETFPDLLPAAEFAGSDGNLQDWKTLSPRVGLSYALDESRRTIVRASYSRYYQQLAFGDVTRENPTSVGYVGYGWTDSNGDRFPQPGEVDLNNIRYSSAVNLANPGSVSADTVNKIDRDRKPRSDDEFIIGLDREIGASFAAGVAFTYRKANNWSATYRFKGACSDTTNPTKDTCPLMVASDYTQNAPVTQNGYTGFTYTPIPALVTAGRSGNLLTNRDGYSTTYKGLELTLNKRLTNKWMSRVAFTYGDWTQNVDLAVGDNGNPTRRQNDGLVDGDQVALLSAGSGKGQLYYTGQKWQFYGNALYQLPWGIDISGSVWGRQGGLKPVFLNIAGGWRRHAGCGRHLDGGRRALRRRLGHRPQAGQDVPLRQAGVLHAGRRVVQRGQLRPGPGPDPPGQQRGLQPDRRGPEPEHLPPRRDLRLLTSCQVPGSFVCRARDLTLFEPFR